jgi:hypothetical protein
MCMFMSLEVGFLPVTRPMKEEGKEKKAHLYVYIFSGNLLLYFYFQSTLFTCNCLPPILSVYIYI